MFCFTDTVTHNFACAQNKCCAQLLHSWIKLCWKYATTVLIFSLYNEFHGFRLLLASQLLWVNFDHFRSNLYFLRHLGQRKLAWALKRNTIVKFSLPKLVKHSVLTISTVQVGKITYTLPEIKIAFSSIWTKFSDQSNLCFLRHYCSLLWRHLSLWCWWRKYETFF